MLSGGDVRLQAGIFIAVFCFCTAMAMAVSDQDTSSGTTEVVGAVVKTSFSGSKHANPSEKFESGGEFDLSAIKRMPMSKIHDSGLFHAKSWYTPPPQPVAVTQQPLPLPPPAAPALPYKYIGRMVDGKNVLLFLSKNDHQFVVKEGDTLDDGYRLDKIGANQAQLTYLPMNEQQTLAFHSDATFPLPQKPSSSPSFGAAESVVKPEAVATVVLPASHDDVTSSAKPNEKLPSVHQLPGNKAVVLSASHSQSFAAVP